MASVAGETQSDAPRDVRDRGPGISAKLLAAVEELFEDGETYMQMTVERLVKVAGISRSTFYLYYEDKTDLLLQLSDASIAALEDAVYGWWELPEATTKEDMRERWRPELHTYREHWAVMSSVVEAAAYDSDVRVRLEEQIRVSIQKLADHIRSGQKAGRMRAEVDPEATASWLGWMFERGMYQLVFSATPKRLDRLLTALTDIIWNTLYRGLR